MYDCFTYTVMATMEGFGFCEKGEVGEFFADGRATYGGDVVVNPHGGLLSEGYIHGLNHHYEAALQLRHSAGVRQVDREPWHTGDGAERQRRSGQRAEESTIGRRKRNHL